VLRAATSAATSKVKAATEKEEEPEPVSMDGVWKNTNHEQDIEGRLPKTLFDFNSCMCLWAVSSVDLCVLDACVCLPTHCAPGVASGIDAILSDIGGSEPGGKGKVNRKAVYAEWFDRNLPRIKEDFPGLKLQQYKDKLFKEWKKSSENPDNQED
jgi:hypothetical protein